MSLEDLYRICEKHGIKFSFKASKNKNEVNLDLYGNRKKLREARKDILRKRPMGVTYKIRNNSMMDYHIMSLIWKVTKSTTFRN